jgi:hypothetical protein
MDEELKSALLETAKRVAAERSWPWREPVEMRPAISVPGQEVWTIRTNAGSRGSSIRLSIRQADFAILDAAFLPR